MIKRPMKGAAVGHDDFPHIRFPTWGFAKLDGFRCVLSKHPLTSTFSRFPNEHLHVSLTGIVPAPHLLDGELVVGKRRGAGVLQRTSSGVTSEDGIPDFTLWVFDAPGPVGSFRKRYELAAEIVASVDHPRIRLLKYKQLNNLDELRAYLAKKLELGYEGIILRDPEALYKEGKSTLKQQGMLKIKPFTDFEARITGYYEEMENTNAAKELVTGKKRRSSAKAGKKAKGTLGGFIGKELKTGEVVRVGGGFTAEQRRRFWAIKDELVAAGAIMKCKKQLMGEKDKPRHPNFVDLRPGWDITR